MQKTQRTEGEWKVKRFSVPIGETGDYDPTCIIVDEDGGEICSIPINIYMREDEENEANAAFICVAVNNYDKLLKVVTDLANLHPDGNPLNHIKAAKELLSSLSETNIPA